ncbi:MAG: ECF transporter S component [Clostridiales bacterium]|jgi:hypothetical protein|nr:ECF transporter S component [Eubacteriales bacterium]MDH7566196.1 ECF transporter S component [Clostridiales bacterium]
MKSKSVREVVLSGLLVAMGLLLPMIFHAFGLGSTFLPMHIPVLLAGFVVSLPFAVAVGAATPILSSVLTGMPPMFPVLPYMVFELAAYGGVACFLYRKLRLNVYVSLVGSMAAGRIVSGLVVWVMATFFMAKLPGPLVFISGGIVQGIPGIIIQLLFIPALVLILSKNNLIKREGLSSGS